MALDTSKIIHAPVGGGRYTVTSPIVKEDYGLYLLIEGLELPETYQVDFSNSEHNGTSVTMIGNSDGVLIPSQFISSGKDVFAFLYHVGADFGRTVYKFRIPNKLRPDRTDDEPTPEEQSTIDQCISALNTAVAQTAQDVIDADQSAQSAQEYAEQAETARDTAQTYANNAQTSANNASASASQASASATASAQSASQAEQIKTDVQGMVSDAQGYASASAQSASASANSASDAQGYANSASASAQSASGYASSAQTSAQTASAKASEASTSASTASQKATEASQSASQALSYKTDAESAKTASQTAQGKAEDAQTAAETAQGLAESARDSAIQAKDDAESAVASISGALIEKAPVITDTASGAIASFSDGADDLPLKSLVVDIGPVQDLHGYDSPWVAGGGKNKVKYPYTDGNSRTINGVTFTVDSQGVITANGTATANAEFIIMNDVGQNLPAGSWTIGGLPSGGGNSSFVFNFYGKDSNNTLLFDYRTGTFRTVTTTADISQLYIGLRIIGGYTCNNVQVHPQFESGSTATSYAPYENICPISGWTQVGVEQSGVNVWDEEWEVGAYNTTNGAKTVSSGQIRSKNHIPISAQTTYHVNTSSNTSAYFKPLFYDENKNYIGTVNSFRDGSFTSPSNAHYMTFYMNANYGTTYNNDISINYPSTDHDYHPYTGRSITINLGQTVYGGKLDVLSGVLTVDRAMVDLGTLSWNYVASSACNFRASELIGAKAPATAVVTPNAICSILTVLDYTTVSTPVDGITIIFATSAQAGKVWAHSGTYTDATAFKAAMTGQTLVYELATPLTVQLTPNQVNSLLGVNNIWADSGDTSAEYRANTQLWVQKKITEAVAAALNS